MPAAGKRGLKPVASRKRGPDHSLTDQAYSKLEELIVTLQLAPGEIVSEAALSRQLRIGRTPIREALHRLARERLVNILSRRFWFIHYRQAADMPLAAKLHAAVARAVAKGDAKAAAAASDKLLDYIEEFTRSTVEAA